MLALQRVRPSKVSVLIVDDTPPCRSVVCELLERRGYTIVGEAGSAAMALDLVDRVTPDAVLLDVHLPDGDGFEVALRLTNSWPALAVLMTAIHAERNFYARAQASGACGFVPKSQLAQVELAAFWPAPDCS